MIWIGQGRTDWLGSINIVNQRNSKPGPAPIFLGLNFSDPGQNQWIRPGWVVPASFGQANIRYYPEAAVDGAFYFVVGYVCSDEQIMALFRLTILFLFSFHWSTLVWLLVSFADNCHCMHVPRREGWRNSSPIKGCYSCFLWNYPQKGSFCYPENQAEGMSRSSDFWLI